MKEIAEIVRAFEVLCGEGKRCALATVVEVRGSSYRRPGARMLIAEDGRTWGGVSGGCLERDVARRARGVMESGRRMVCRYDTDDEELTAVTTGCQGVIDILIQPVSRETVGPMGLLKRVVEERVEVRIEEGAFVEVVKPALELVVFGGGNDVVPVVGMGKMMGWRVTVVVGRPGIGAMEKFAQADCVVVTGSDEPTEGVEMREGAAVVLLTHNYLRDLEILKKVPERLGYLGVLGPKRRTEKLLSEIGERLVGKVHYPVGLDLGERSPEGIALAIVAEIQAVVAGGSGRPMRMLAGPISGNERVRDACRV